jgi:hypothetical protein
MTPWQESLSQIDNDYIHHSNQDSSFDDEPEAPAEEPVVEMETKTKVKRSFSISKRDMRVLLYLRQVLQAHNEDEEAQKRSKLITKVEAVKFTQKPNSLSQHLHDLLLPAGKTGLHINDIIEGIEKAGYNLQSKYHKYSQVNSALRRHGYMVLRIGRGTFRLRDGFLNKKQVKQPVKQVITSSNLLVNKVPKLIDIAKYVIVECQDHDLTPQKVWYIMSQMGYNCSLRYLNNKMREHNIVLGKEPRGGLRSA